MKLIVSLTPVVFLAACGGTTQTSDVLAFVETGPLSLAEIDEVGSALEVFGTEVGAETIRGVQRSDLEAQGSASYSGYLISDHQSRDISIVGRTTVDVDFTGGGSASGEVSDFVHVDTSFGRGRPLTDLDELGSFSVPPFPSTATVTPIPGLLTLSDGELSEDDEGIGGIFIAANGSWTLDAALSSTGNTEVFDVVGGLTGGVGTDGTLIAAGVIQAESSDEGFDVDAVLFAREAQ